MLIFFLGLIEMNEISLIFYLRKGSCKWESYLSISRDYYSHSSSIYSFLSKYFTNGIFMAADGIPHAVKSNELAVNYSLIKPSVEITGSNTEYLWIQCVHTRNESRIFVKFHLLMGMRLLLLALWNGSRHGSEIFWR